MLPPNQAMQMFPAQQQQIPIHAKPFHPAMHYPQQNVNMFPYGHPYQGQYYVTTPYGAHMQYA